MCDCPKCHGNGELEAKSYLQKSDFIFENSLEKGETAVLCPYCNGAGAIEEQ